MWNTLHFILVSAMVLGHQHALHPRDLRETQIHDFGVPLTYSSHLTTTTTYDYSTSAANMYLI